MDTKPTFTFSGVGGILEVYEDRVQIKPKGLLGALNIQGGETIFIKDITSVEVRKCSFFNGGHIQFSAPGAKEASIKIEFSSLSNRKKMNENANKIKAFVIKRLQVFKAAPTSTPTSSSSDEILKLSKLKQDGIISEEEFQSAKKKLLGI